MIKLIISDFDGILADLKEVHFEALNKALELINPKFSITEEEHITIYDGLSTKRKLDLLIKNKGLPKDKIQDIYDNKQKFTMELMDEKLSLDIRLVEILEKLKSEGYLLYVASNAIRKTIEVGLSKLGVLHLFDKIFSNEDVKLQKPNPEIYLKCFVEAGASPKECIILEDSKHGRESAVKSGAYVCGIDNPSDLSYEKIQSTIIFAKNNQSKIKWAARDTTVLIPMAGLGSRFKTEGYRLPKPLIDVDGKPMIQKVVENLNIDGNYVFVVQSQHYDEYNLGILLPLIVPGCKIIKTNGVTEGAACTTLLAKELINNNNHLLIANSDQFVEWDSCDFMYSMIYNNIDGGILTFKDKNANPKWSFVKVDNNGFATEVAEKNPISDLATVGIYYFNKGNEYVHYAEQMINKNIKTNNEYYVCPIYNEYISDNKKIRTKECKNMWGLGTPGDLRYFLSNFKEE